MVRFSDQNDLNDATMPDSCEQANQYFEKNRLFYFVNDRNWYGAVSREKSLQDQRGEV